MKRALDEGTVRSIHQTLLERFGEPIDQGLSLDDVELSKGKREPDPNDPLVMKDAMGRVVGRWTGAVEPANKGSRPPKKIGESENGGRHPGHAGSCTCPDCSRSSEEELDEKTPPGREKQVKALKKDKGVDNPWAVAWASYDKR